MARLRTSVTPGTLGAIAFAALVGVIVLPTGSGLSGGGSIFSLVVIGFLLFALMRGLARRSAHARNARISQGTSDLVVGPDGDVRQLGAPHTGYNSDTTRPPVAAATAAAAPRATPRPAPSAPPKEVAAQRPRAATGAPRPVQGGSCLFTREWHPSVLQESSLHARG